MLCHKGSEPSVKNRVFRIAVCLLGCAVAAWSQTATGTIIGTVTDNSGAAVASAKVTVVNTGTSAKVKTSTNAEGDYTAPLLPPGSYSIAVTAPGFKAFEQ